MKTKLIPRYIILIIISVFMLAPFYWMFSTSLKEYSKVLLFPPQFFPYPVAWGNYLELFSQQPFHLYLLNSLFVSSLTTIGTVAFASLAGYAFAKLRFKGRNILFLIVLSGMMMPVEISTIPLFLGFSKIRLTDSFIPLIIPQIFGYGGAFGVFLMRQFFITVPDSLVEAARIDGSSPWKTYLHIMLPLSTSVIATLCIFTFLNNWNEIFLPLIYLSDSDKFTIPLALSLFTSENGVEWHLIMAAATVATLPILIVFFFAQRKFIESFAMSGIK
jgi:multiple sugar transport system permease protein